MMPDGAKDGESKYLHLLVNLPRDRSPAFCERFDLGRPIKTLKRPRVEEIVAKSVGCVDILYETI